MCWTSSNGNIMVTKLKNSISQRLFRLLRQSKTQVENLTKQVLLNKCHSQTRIKNKLFVLKWVLPPCFPSDWPMSNAAVVTQALYGGGHSTALLLTTGGLLSRSDLFGHVVINLFDLFLLSCLECFSFTWRGRSVQGRLLFQGCEQDPSYLAHHHWAISILVWAQKTLTHGGVQGETHTRWRGPGG